MAELSTAYRGNHTLAVALQIISDLEVAKRPKSEHKTFGPFSGVQTRSEIKFSGSQANLGGTDQNFNSKNDH